MVRLKYMLALFLPSCLDVDCWPLSGAEAEAGPFELSQYGYSYVLVLH